MKKYNKKYTYKQALHILLNKEGYQMSLPEWGNNTHLRVYNNNIYNFEILSYNIMKDIISNISKDINKLSDIEYSFLCKIKESLLRNLNIPKDKFIYLDNSTSIWPYTSGIYILSIEECKRKDWIITKI